MTIGFRVSCGESLSVTVLGRVMTVLVDCCCWDGAGWIYRRALWNIIIGNVFGKDNLAQRVYLCNLWLYVQYGNIHNHIRDCTLRCILNLISVRDCSTGKSTQQHRFIHERVRENILICIISECCYRVCIVMESVCFVLYIQIFATIIITFYYQHLILFYHELNQ